MVGAEHAARSRTLLYLFWDSPLAIDQKEPRHLCWVAGWILCMQMLDMYIIVLPALHGTGVHLSIWDLLSLIAIGATLGFVYLRIVPRTSLFPVRDPRLIESLNLVN